MILITKYSCIRLPQYDREILAFFFVALSWCISFDDVWKLASFLPRISTVSIRSLTSVRGIFQGYDFVYLFEGTPWKHSSPCV